MAATAEDHGALLDIFEGLGEMIDGFDRHAKDYATRVYLSYRENRRGLPSRPPGLNLEMAKAIRELVLDEVTAQRRTRR